MTPSEATHTSAWAHGVATYAGDTVLDAWFPSPVLGDPDGSEAPDELSALAVDDDVRGVRRAVVTVEVKDLQDAPGDTLDVWLRLHLLSHRLVRPHSISLDGVFRLLTNVVWTSVGPCAVEGFEQTRMRLRAAGHQVTVLGVDKFPRMVDYVVPAGVRIGDADRVRLGAHLAEGTTVMHEGFVNYNAGTSGASMIEGRVSAGVVVGDGTDVGGGASIMGTLSGGGTRGDLDRRALPDRRQRRHRHLARRRLRGRGRLLRHGRHQGHGQGHRPQAQGGQGGHALGLRQRAVPPQLRDRHRRGGAVEERGRGPQHGPACELESLVFLLVLVVIGGVGVAMWRGVGPLPDPEGCATRVAGTRVDLSPEQARNASVIAAVGVRRELPARAVSIALATAFQESKLRNLDHGDRDSLGIFQQRPSQGWGTKAQVRDPYYASNAFYDVLAKIDGFQTMRITEAAQQVQRSGYPEAYEPHAADARALASALTGYSRGGRFTCVVHASDGKGTYSAATRTLEKGFGPLDVAKRARQDFTVTVGDDAAGRRRGWAVAQFLTAHAATLKVTEVVFDGKRWRVGKESEQGWTSAKTESGRVRVSLG